MSDWFTGARTSAARFVRMDGARTVLVQPTMSPFAKAAGLAIVLTLALVALVIIIPFLVFGAIIFVASLAVLKVRQLFSGLTGRLPRDDGRQNVRVRLPADTTEP